MTEFDREGNWSITQRSEHYSVSGMVLRDRPQSVKFMLIEFTDLTALSYGARAPLELVPRPRWLKREVESDQAICVANASTREQNVDC